MKQINHIYTTKEGHLPSTLATISDNTYDYVAGPKIAASSQINLNSDFFIFSLTSLICFVCLGWKYIGCTQYL